MEKRLRSDEARLGWLHGVTGAVHAVRRELFRPLPPGTILDDMWIPLHVALGGRWVWMARDAILHDRISANAREEFSRKLRTLAGNWQLLVRLPVLLDPSRNPVFFAWFSHKFLRLLVPWALLLALLASAILSGTVYRIAFVAQLLGYAWAAVGLRLPRLAARMPLSVRGGDVRDAQPGRAVVAAGVAGARCVATVEEALMASMLFVTSRLPFPPREGHQLRSWHVLKALATEHEVTLLSFARADDDLDAAGEMRSHLAGVETFPIASERSKLALAWALLRSTFSREPFVSTKYASRAMRARIAELSRDADVVHFDMLPLMRYADAVPASVPVVYNAHNVEHVLLATRARMHDNWLARLFLRRQLSRLLGFERNACRRAKLVLACSGTDAQLLRTLAPDTRVTIVPNGVDLENNRPARGSGNGRARLVFVGQMGWFPNRDGVEWFLHDVFPRIVLERPDAEFVLVGKADGLEVPADIASHVKLAGFVPDLRPLVHAAAVYVVPLRAGSGTRLKVLEAMALGKAIVTTSIGSEGIVLRHGRSALYADDADDVRQGRRVVARIARDAQRTGHRGTRLRGKPLRLGCDRARPAGVLRTPAARHLGASTGGTRGRTRGCGHA